MAEGKKSFVAYSDWHNMFNELPDEVAGKLIKHIFSYVNDENPNTDDYVINALFQQVKSTLKRDLEKWEAQRVQRSEAGKKSAEIRATKINERSTSVNETERKATVSVSVSVSEDIINNIYKLYPTSCPIKKSSTGKCQKNKTTIKQLLKTNSAERLENIIKWYLNDCKKNDVFIKNFSTFLKNLPDVSDQELSGAALNISKMMNDWDYITEEEQRKVYMHIYNLPEAEKTARYKAFMQSFIEYAPTK